MVKKNITIDDVAQAANVSKTTVSRYLNHREDLMTEKTRDRIKKVIELLDYHPSEVARSLKLKRTKTIGVIISDMRSPFFSAVISGIEEQLNESGYSAIYANSSNSHELEIKHVQTLLTKDVDGLIINTADFYNDDLVSMTINRIPVVLIDRYINNHHLSIVGPNSKKMFDDLFKHLKTQSFNRFALFIEPWEHVSTRMQRRESFLRNVKEHYDYDASADIFPIGSDYASYEEGLQAFIQSLREGDIPCVIGGNSVTTFSTYHAICDLKMRVPEDIGIAGPDDWSWGNDMSWPDVMASPVTTLVFDAIEIGRKAAELIIEKIDNPHSPVQDISIPVNLIIRKSTLR